MLLELSIFNVFKGFTIFLCQIHLPLENKNMFLHPNMSFSVIFFQLPCFNWKYEQYTIAYCFRKLGLKSDFFKFFFHIFICLWKKSKKIHSLARQYIFFSKIAQITYFYAFILILRQYIYFSLKSHKWPFFKCFSEIYYF